MMYKEFIEEVAEKANVSKKVADQVFRTAIEVVRESLLKGENMRIMGLGVLYVAHRKPRMAMNPRKGTKVHVPAKRTVRLRVAKDLKRDMNGGKK